MTEQANGGNNTQNNGKPTKRYTEQNVYKDSEVLLFSLLQYFRHIPRDMRFLLGSRMVNDALDMSKNISRGFRVSDGTRKSGYITEAQVLCDSVTVIIEALHNIEVISTDFYLQSKTKLDNIQAQLYSWRKFIEHHRDGENMHK
jgi:hypothetical protein